MTCTHTDAEIIEQGTAERVYKPDGAIEDADTWQPSRWLVSCPACGLQRVYTISNKPQWLSVLIKKRTQPKKPKGPTVLDVLRQW